MAGGAALAEDVREVGPFRRQTRDAMCADFLPDWVQILTRSKTAFRFDPVRSINLFVQFEARLQGRLEDNEGIPAL
jgi:hypothetical protein